MASVDDRVVRMEFDNAAFERRMETTLNSLDRLNKSLQLQGAQRGFSDVQAAANHLNLGVIAAGVDHIASRFTALGAVGFSVLQRLTNGALSFVKKLGGDILDPIIGGGKNRAINLEQAKFQFEGLGINVDKAMASALAAVKGTAFGLDEAAKSAAVFAGAGIKAGDDMTAALRGISGVAAQTGKSFTEIGDIFTSSAGTGVVNNQDLQQFATRGLNAAAAVGKVMGKTEAQVHKMAADGKLDFKTFAAAMDEAFGKHATDANKTFTGAFANMRTALARMGASFFTPELVHFRDIFNALSPVIDNVSEAFKPVIDSLVNITNLTKGKGLKFLFLRNLNWDDIKNAATNFGAALSRIFITLGLVFSRFKKAFRDIFPKTSVSGIEKISQVFLSFADLLVPSMTTLRQFGRIFKGFFAIASIGWTIIKALANIFLDLESRLVGLGRGNVLEFFADIADWFITLKETLVDAGGITKFFDKLSITLAKPIPIVAKLKEIFKNIFGGFDLGAFDKMDVKFGRIGQRFETLQKIVSKIKDIWAPLKSALDKIFGILDHVWEGIKQFFAELGDKIAAVFGEGSFNKALDAFNTALIGGIIAILINFSKNGLSVDLTGGVLKNLSGTFSELTNTLQTMQLKIKAEALMKIAEAIALLSASVLVLSLVDSGKLTKAMGAMTVGFGQLVGTMTLLTKLNSDPKKAGVFVAMAAAMNILATAMIGMSIALLILSTISPEDLVRGLAAMTGSLVILSGTAVVLSQFSGSFILASIGIVAISGAMILLAAALKIFATMSWGEIAKGLTVLAASLVIIGATVSAMSPTMILTAPALLAVAVAMSILGGALKIFASMSWEDIGKGMTVLAGSLIIIGATVSSMPVTLPLTAAGLVLVADALVIISGVLLVLGGMSWKEIAKGLVTLGGALIIIGAAVSGMTGAIVGAIALGIVSVALLGIVDVVERFASLKTGDLIRALIGIAAALTVIGVAAYILLTTGATIGILALGYALVVLGAGFALIGAGAYLLAKSFEAIVNSIKTLAGMGSALVDFVKVLGKSFTALARGAAEGVVEFVKTIGESVPGLLKLAQAILDQLLDTLIKLVPKFLKLVQVLIGGFLDNVKTLAPKFVAAGIVLITQLLNGLNGNVDQWTNAGISIVLQFIGALTARAQDLVNAGARLLITVIFGLINRLPDIVAAVAALIAVFLYSLAAHVDQIADAGGHLVISVIHGIARQVPQITQAVGDLIITFIGAMGKQANRIITAGRKMIENLLEGIADNAVALARSAANILIDFLAGLRRAIDEKMPEIRHQGWLLAGAIINGMTGGLAEKAKNVVSSIGGVIGGAISEAKKKLRSHSPSKVFFEIAQGMVEGMVLALDHDTTLKNSTSNLAATAAENMRDALTVVTDGLGNTKEFNPTITPVLDLTQVQNEAARIAEFIDATQKLTPEVSLKNAKVIASDTKSQNGSDSSKSTDTSGGGDVSFEQNIYGPTKTSAADLYRATKSQFTKAKEELGL